MERMLATEARPAGVREQAEADEYYQTRSSLDEESGQDSTPEARQFAETERAYGGKPVYDKEKDAGRTKLNYRQWVQVRTPTFKQWFGDWEAVRAKNALDSMIPVTVDSSALGHRDINPHDMSSIFMKHISRVLLERNLRREHDHFGIFSWRRAPLIRVRRWFSNSLSWPVRV
jgi:hypothetical protein